MKSYITSDSTKQRRYQKMRCVDWFGDCNGTSEFELSLRQANHIFILKILILTIRDVYELDQIFSKLYLKFDIFTPENYIAAKCWNFLSSTLEAKRNAQ